jgi:hypothetical protein
MNPNGTSSRAQRFPVWLLLAAALLMALGLVWVEQRWPVATGVADDSARQRFHAGVEALKLVIAALIGGLVSAVHRRYPGDKPISRSLAQAQVLLCVAGALMMIIIGNSFARALGIAGGATIVRFRTPVDDAKDSTVLFLGLGLGMACGLGEFGVAGLGMAFLCLCLVLLDWIVERKPRAMILEMVATDNDFPADYVNRLLAAYQVQFEPREVSQQGQKATVRNACTLDPDTPLQRLSEQLTDASAAGLKSVTWETPKKGDLKS